MNINNLVAEDVYRVHEQVHSNAHRPAKLKHRKVGKFREVPLPRSVREAIERHEKKHGTTREGYLLRGRAVLHGADGTPVRPRTLREAARGGRDGDVRLPAPVEDIRATRPDRRTTPHGHPPPGGRRTRTRILDGIDLRVPAGSVFALPHIDQKLIGFSSRV
ncbi:hypothetical protein ACF1FC_34315 [Streptomyces sp. NPDC014344]|uniref:hypothetical protein n=1 Tax=Streptomyces sp. NPDC014344 TaxID=3364871 RepID=UPI0036FED6D7